MLHHRVLASRPLHPRPMDPIFPRARKELRRAFRLKLQGSRRVRAVVHDCFWQGARLPERQTFRRQLRHSHRLTLTASIIRYAS